MAAATNDNTASCPMCVAVQLLHASRQQPVAVKVLDAGSNESTCFERVYNEVRQRLLRPAGTLLTLN